MTKTVVLKTHSLIKVTEYLNNFISYCNKISIELKTKFPNQLLKSDYLTALESYDESYFNQYEKNALKTIEDFEKFFHDDTNEEKKEIRLLLNLSVEYKELLTKTIQLYGHILGNEEQILKNIDSLNEIHHEIHVCSRIFIYKLTEQGIGY